MLHEFTLPNETIQVCPVESGGAAFALPEAAVIGVMPLDDNAVTEMVDGVLAMAMDDRYRPLVSLGDALCLPGDPAAEQQVVVIRIGAQLFGLLVERAGAADTAVIHPTFEPASGFAMFSNVVRLADGRDVPVLNPARLALSAKRVEPTATDLRLAA